jgi:flagellar motor switch protein FliN
MSGAAPTLAALGDVEVALTVAVGAARCSVDDVLAFTEGSVISLNASSDSPVELLVNGVAVASGELVELDDGTLAIEVRSVRSRTTEGTNRA